VVEESKLWWIRKSHCFLFWYCSDLQIATSHSQEQLLGCELGNSVRFLLHCICPQPDCHGLSSKCQTAFFAQLACILHSILYTLESLKFSTIHVLEYCKPSQMFSNVAFCKLIWFWPSSNFLCFIWWFTHQIVNFNNQCHFDAQVMNRSETSLLSL
jgi:hypothetical protein